MILVRNLRLLPEEDFSLLRLRAAQKLRVPEARILSCRLTKRSLDARKKDRIHWVCSVVVSVSGDESKLLGGKDPDIAPYQPPVYEIPVLSSDERPVIVGFGPAGMFAALVLARAGLRPIVLERGLDALSRRAAVERFRSGGPLDPECNVQFGEGGAGTFSDGKLNTGTHDPRIHWVLEQFYRHGAHESVLWDAKPHIGTDILVDVVQSIRREIVSLGGEVRFSSRMTALELRDGAVAGLHVRSSDSERFLPCRQVILAIGHSARDTVEALYGQGLKMERKAFAMGVRIEHRQADIDLAQYGRGRGSLPAADYGLHVHLPDGTGVFTFCMCPGGEVIAAASEPDGLVTNGMSLSARDSDNANSALLVGLAPEDFPGEGPLAGMIWQRSIEQAAWRCGGGNAFAPAQTVGSFLTGVSDEGPGRVLPSYRPGVVWTDLHEILPRKITDALAAALPLFGSRLAGFDVPDAVLTGPETRSSSPVRMVRGSDLSSSIRGLWPCGEGAGYAGGITSASVDGMRCAEAVMRSLDNK